MARSCGGAQLSCTECNGRTRSRESPCWRAREAWHLLGVALLVLSSAAPRASAQDDDSAPCKTVLPPLPPRPPPSPPLARPPRAVALARATGITVQPTPSLKAANGSRYNGSVNSDPQRRPLVQGLYEVLGQESEVVAVHLVHIPRTDTYLYMERPSTKRSRSWQIAGTFDLTTRNWTRVAAVDGLFCCGHTIDSEGRVIVTGGHKQSAGWADGMRSVRIFDITGNATSLVNQTWMSWKRWYPTPTLLPDGQIMIMGGRPEVGGSGPGVQEYELYDPLRGARRYPLPCRMVEDSFYRHMKKMYYPFNFVLPTGDVFVFGERQARVMVAQTGVFRTNASGEVNFAPRLPGSVLSQFPYTASGVFGALSSADNYSSVDLMVFGGAVVQAVDDNDMIAGRGVRRLRISWKRGADGAFAYSFGSWTEEDLGIPRVMGDGTLLPNGDVLLLNGAQVGVAGDSGSSGGSGGRANYPNLWAQLYQPDRPLNQRVSTLAASTIARMYHGTAALTSNGTILVTGCDRCFRLTSDVPSYVSPPIKDEYRNEIFYPPYWFDTANKPRILSINGQAPRANGTLRTGPTLGYNQFFTIKWGATLTGNVTVPPVTRVSLVAPSSTTHSFNSNQRVVFLEIVAINYTTREATVRTPPHPYIAPPQWYMVFALNGKTYSTAAWVRMVDLTGAGKVVPA